MLDRAASPGSGVFTGRNLAGLVLAAGFVLAGCSEAPVVTMLHRMPSYAGEVRFQPDDGVERSCDLAFHRGNGNLQVKVTRGERVVTLVRSADGVRAFESAAERPVTPAERTTFALVASFVDSSSIAGVEPGPETYRVRIGKVWYRVQLESQTETRIHGHPR